MEKKKWQKKEGGRKGPTTVGPTIKFNNFFIFHLVFGPKDQNDTIFIYIKNYLDKMIYIKD